MSSPPSSDLLEIVEQGRTQTEELNVKFLVQQAELNEPEGLRTFQRRLASCNLLFVYTGHPTRHTVIYDCARHCDQNSSELERRLLFDHHSVQSILNATRHIDGKVDTKELSQDLEKNMAPGPACLYKSLFLKKTLYKFLDTKTSSYYQDPVYIVTAALRPFGVSILEASAYKQSTSLNRYTTPVVTSGRLASSQHEQSPLLIPLNNLINFNLYSRDIAKNISRGLFFVVGPASEISRGSDVGGHEYRQPNNTELSRYICNPTVDEFFDIYNQSLVGMFYIANHAATNQGVLEDLVQRCQANFKTGSLPNNLKVHKTVAVIKIGLQLPADNSMTTFTTDDNTPIVAFTNMNFSANQEWSYRSFYYNTNT